jgi:hypothetical protein
MAATPTSSLPALTLVRGQGHFSDLDDAWLESLA